MDYKEKLIQIITILEERLTKGEIENTFFSLTNKDKGRLDKYRKERLFWKYNIIFEDNNDFQLIAETKPKNLNTSILYFEKMKNIFDELGIESSIQISSGAFIFNVKDSNIKEEI